MRLTTYGALTILLALSRASVSGPVRGVAPQDVEKYVPTADGKWSCLANPEIVLEWSQVNDDYCDCPDGSDEPGTSACPNGKFWCMNSGHEGQFIPSSLVGDGVCDYDVCCDGSDELGVRDCNSICERMHTENEFHKKEAERERKIAVDKTAKTQRAAKRLRTKLEEKLKVSEALLSFHERELKRFGKMLEDRQEKSFGPLLKQLKTKTEEARVKIYEQFSAMALTERNLHDLKSIGDKLVETFNENLNDAAVKKTVEDLKTHAHLNKRAYANWPEFEKLQRSVFDKFNGSVQEVSTQFDWVKDELSKSLKKHDKMKIRLDELERFLDHLSENYNPNFNDLNVKEAVNAYQDYASNKQQITIADGIVDAVSAQLANIKEGVSTVQLEYKANTDPESVSAPVKAASGKKLFDTLKSRVHFMWNDFLGIGPPKRLKMPEPESDEEHAAVIAEFESQKADEVKSIAIMKAELEKNYGPNDIYRAMDGVMATSHIGEYDYELEFIGEVRQKGGNGHDVLIGTFDHVDAMEDKEGVIAYYENGAKCWNGPRRRAVIKVECGAEHQVLGVSEPEKCEYHFRMKSPLGCFINDGDRV